MPVALGFIEINSLIGAAEASNVMAKTSNIILLGKEILSPGLITIKIVGEKESVEAAIIAGAEAVRNLERNFSSHIIVDPDEQVFSVFPEIRSLYFSLKKIPRRKIKKPSTEKAITEVETSKAETGKPETVTGKSKTKSGSPCWRFKSRLRHRAYWRMGLLFPARHNAPGTYAGFFQRLCLAIVTVSA